MSLKTLLIEKGTILVRSKLKLFTPNETTTLLVVSKKDVVTSSGKPGLEITYLEETREIKKKHKAAENEFVVERIHRAYDVTHPKNMVFEVREDLTLLGTDSRAYDFYTILPSSDLVQLEEMVMCGPALGIISAAKNVIDHIPIHFKVTDMVEESKVRFELDSYLLTEGEIGKPIISIIDPMFFDNNKYSCTGKSKAEALLKFRNELKHHINLLNVILHKADEEWENFNDSENSSVSKDNEKCEKLE